MDVIKSANKLKKAEKGAVSSARFMDALHHTSLYFLCN